MFQLIKRAAYEFKSMTKRVIDNPIGNAKPIQAHLKQWGRIKPIALKGRGSQCMLELRMEHGLRTDLMRINGGLFALRKLISFHKLPKESRITQVTWVCLRRKAIRSYRKTRCGSSLSSRRKDWYFNMTDFCYRPKPLKANCLSPFSKLTLLWNVLTIFFLLKVSKKAHQINLYEGLHSQKWEVDVRVEGEANWVSCLNNLWLFASKSTLYISSIKEKSIKKGRGRVDEGREGVVLISGLTPTFVFNHLLWIKLLLLKRNTSYLSFIIFQWPINLISTASIIIYIPNAILCMPLS